MSTDDLPARARAARKSRGWTQDQAATQIGMSLRAYQNFESRNGTPQPENLRNIVRVYELDAASMNGSGDAVAEATRSSWPLDVQVFLDVMGAYLVTLPAGERMDTIRTLTRQIFEARRAPAG